MNVIRRGLSLVLSLAMTAALLPACPVFAEEIDPADCSVIAVEEELPAEESVLPEEDVEEAPEEEAVEELPAADESAPTEEEVAVERGKPVAEAPEGGTIVSFGKLAADEIGLVDKGTVESVTAMMPETIPVYLEGRSEAVQLPVSWYCATEYEDSDDYYYQFNPEWDELNYPLAAGMDPEDSAPYIAVYLAQPGMMAGDGADGIVRASTSNADKIFNYLTGDMGLNSAAACGILANMYCESALNPTAVGDHGTSYGLCQWHNGRYTNLKNWCKNNGYDYKTVKGQLHFLQYELVTYYSGILSHMQGVANTADGAYDGGYYWCYYFEQPADKARHSKVRGKMARDTYWPTYGNQLLSGAPVEPEIYNATLPETSMEYGTFFTLRGTIVCASNIVRVTAGVYDSNNQSVTKKTMTVNSNSFDVYSMDNDVLFSQVPVGSYTYRIKATVGETKYIVLEHPFTVTARQMGDAGVKLSSKMSYTGRERKPAPVVTYGKKELVKGEDYTVTYANNQDIGTATCIIKGKGNYSGKVKKTFQIVPAKVAGLAAASTSAGKVNVTWTPNTKRTRGYQIQYSTSSDFSNAQSVTVVGKELSSATLTGLKSGKTYYVRIRAYYRVNGVSFRSRYSTKVQVKVK